MTDSSSRKSIFRHSNNTNCEDGIVRSEKETSNSSAHSTNNNSNNNDTHLQLLYFPSKLHYHQQGLYTDNTGSTLDTQSFTTDDDDDTSIDSGVSWYFKSSTGNVVSTTFTAGEDESESSEVLQGLSVDTDVFTRDRYADNDDDDASFSSRSTNVENDIDNDSTTTTTNSSTSASDIERDDDSDDNDDNDDNDDDNDDGRNHNKISSYHYHHRKVDTFNRRKAIQASWPDVPALSHELV